jgi:hypothetical protein
MKRNLKAMSSFNRNESVSVESVSGFGFNNNWKEQKLYSITAGTKQHLGTTRAGCKNEMYEMKDNTWILR